MTEQPREPLLLPEPDPHITVQQAFRWGSMKWLARVHVGFMSYDAYAWTERGAERKARRLLARQSQSRKWRARERRIEVDA